MKIHTINKYIFAQILGLLPVFAFAQQNVKGIVASIVGTVGDYLMPLLFISALTYFIWGVVSFIRDAENSDEREKGKSRIIWGIIALFAMTAYLGLTQVLTQSVFGTTPILPQLFTN